MKTQPLVQPPLRFAVRGCNASLSYHRARWDEGLGRRKVAGSSDLLWEFKSLLVYIHTDRQTDIDR